MEKVPFQLDTKEQSYQSLHKLFVYDVRQNLQFIFLSWYFNGINPREFSLDSQNLILAKKKKLFPLDFHARYSTWHSGSLTLFLGQQTFIYDVFSVSSTHEFMKRLGSLE